MHEIELLVILLAVTAALAEVANRLRVPYPVLLVVAGLALSLLPGLPPVALAPNLVFFVFLPPLLYASAWELSWSAFRAEARTITWLAVGGVLFSLAVVAAVAYYVVPGFGWGPAFVLAAIVSPTDAISASLATRGLPVARRLIVVLEGESLVNDATGLIAYRYAVAAVVTGHFALGQAAGQLLLVTVVGIAVGLAVAAVFYGVHRISRTSTAIDTSLNLLTPYAAYLLAEAWHGSGVLAVVAAALFGSYYSGRIFAHDRRLQANAVWDTLEFLLNGLVFILIGLQLPAVVAGVAPGGLRRAHQPGGTRRAHAVGVPQRLPAALAGRPLVHRPRRPHAGRGHAAGVGRDAWGVIAGRRAGSAAGAARRRGLSTAQPHATAHLRRYSGVAAGAGPHAAPAHRLAGAGGR
jgi:CPA1 family monovalent cation:H+ antiporter